MKSFATLAILCLLAPSAIAQVPAASKDPASAPAGNYTLDTRHTSVIARVGHMGGISSSTFRFGTSSGTLAWDGAKPEASKVSVTIDMSSLMTPVPNFAGELTGDKFLKTGQFHDATFVSTAIMRTGPTTGTINGNLTFMGVTKPLAIEATLGGTGKNRQGPVIGFAGKAHFKRTDFGFTALMGIISDEVELLLDVEFDKAG